MAPNRILTQDGSGDWITPYPPSPLIKLVLRTRMFASTLKATGVGVESDWTERLKEGWETKVLAILDGLSNGTWTQKAVMAAIKKRTEETRFSIFIFPREYHPKNTPSGGKDELEIIDQYMNSAADGDSKDAVPPGGEPCRVYFDPDPWQSDSIIRQEAELLNPSKFGGVGMEPETVLFHELVHAIRRLKGTTDRTKTKTSDYVNLEEFTAVLIANIATSEKNHNAKLRYCERTFVAMPEPYKTSEGFLRKPEHAELIKKIVDRDPSLARDIAGSPIPNPFNPIRRHLKGALWPAPRAAW